jgi:hypothetical protein
MNKAWGMEKEEGERKMENGERSHNVIQSFSNTILQSLRAEYKGRKRFR